MPDRNTTAVRRIKFLAKMARAQKNRADDFRHSGSPLGSDDYVATYQTVGVSEVSLLLDMPRLPVYQ